jgi:hypothetical protein
MGDRPLLPAARTRRAVSATTRCGAPRNWAYLRAKTEQLRAEVRMIVISDGFAPVLVSALRDALERCRERIDRGDAKEVADEEEFFIHLGSLVAEVREQYLAREKLDPQMIPYAALWPQTEPSPATVPLLTLVETTAPLGPTARGPRDGR